MCIQRRARNYVKRPSPILNHNIYPIQYNTLSNNDGTTIRRKNYSMWLKNGFISSTAAKHIICFNCGKQPWKQNEICV